MGLRIIMLVLVLLAADLKAQERNLDYQYALIEAVRQKNLGDLNEAVKIYRSIIKEKPDCDVAYYELGSIYLGTQQSSLAEQLLGQAYSMDPENKWYVLAYLHALAQMENYDQMQVILEKQLKKEKTDDEWVFQLAQVYFFQGKTRRAVRTIEKLEDEKGSSVRIYLTLAGMHEADGDTLAQMVELRKVLELDSLHISALSKLADYHWKRGEYGLSLAYVEKSFYSPMVEMNQQVASLGLFLSKEELETDLGDELSRAMETLLRIHPEAWEARLMATDFYIQRKEYGLSYGHLKAFISGNKANYPAYMQAILLANAASMPEELLWMSGEALGHFPDSMDIRFFRGLAFYEQRNYEELLDNFRGMDHALLSRKEYISQSKMMVAEGLYRLGDFARSDSTFEALIQEEPDNYMVLNNYSYYLAERGEKLDKAEGWSKKAIENNPENSTFLDTYAWVLFKKGDYPEAEKYILKALNMGGENDPEVNEHAGDIQQALGSPELAAAYYQKAIILGGDQKILEDKIKHTDQ